MSVSIFRSQDIIEDGEERLEAEMALEESLRTLRVVEGWLAAEDTKSGPGMPGMELGSGKNMERLRCKIKHSVLENGP